AGEPSRNAIYSFCVFVFQTQADNSRHTDSRRAIVAIVYNAYLDYIQSGDGPSAVTDTRAWRESCGGSLIQPNVALIACSRRSSLGVMAASRAGAMGDGTSGTPTRRGAAFRRSCTSSVTVATVSEEQQQVH